MGIGKHLRVSKPYEQVPGVLVQSGVQVGEYGDHDSTCDFESNPPSVERRHNSEEEEEEAENEFLMWSLIRAGGDPFRNWTKEEEEEEWLYLWPTVRCSLCMCDVIQIQGGWPCSHFGAARA